MPTQISDNGASLKIVTDDGSRLILKNQIREVDVVRDTIIKIDIGQGALYNVFIDQADVTAPVSASPEDLRDQIMALLQVSIAGEATQQNQLAQIEQIRSLQGMVSVLGDKVKSIDDKTKLQPALIDESNASTVYEGFAVPGVKTSDAVWAIMKITNKKGVLAYQWAAGNKNFDKVWDTRKTLVYS